MGAVNSKHLVFFLVILSLFMISCQDNLQQTEHKTVREPVVAGTWYAGDYTTLKNNIETFLARAEDKNIENLKALIVPHAGHSYSGQVAAEAFKQITEDYETVIILGPSHKYPLKGVSILNVTHYKTPLGEIKLSDKVKEMLNEPVIESQPDAHANEHSIEIELPFLQKQLDDFELIPILVGSADVNALVELIEKYSDEKTLIVISVDLSHYHSYDEANELDSYSINTILNLSIENLQNCEIDAPWAIATLMYLSQKNNWKPKLLDYKNSGDVTGDKTRGVVGYASIAFYKEGMGEQDKEFLLKLARQTLNSYVKEKNIPVVKESSISKELLEEKGCFVTLEKQENLRGCIGHIFPKEALYKCIIDNAVNAAVNDRRFWPVTEDELDDIEVEVSVLSVPKTLKFSSSEDLLSKLTPLKHGVVLNYGFRQSTYLPQVWEQIPEKETFLSSLCMKGGSKADCWKEPDVEIETYTANVFSESEFS